MRTALKGTPVLPFIPPKGIIQKGGEFYQSDYSPKLLAQAGAASTEKPEKSVKSSKKTATTRKKSASTTSRSSGSRSGGNSSSSGSRPAAAKPAAVESLF